MFQDVLPDHVREDVRKQREHKDDLQGQINYVYSELDTYNDAQLSKFNISKLKDSLKTKTKIPTSINAVGTEPIAPTVEEAPSPPARCMASIERMINDAMDRANRGRDTARKPPGSRSSSAGSSKGGGLIPNPRFKGCWRCGKEGHSRANFSEFLAIKAKNGGKVRKYYVGAYEKNLKNKPTKVNVLITEDVDDELEETVRMWPVMGIPEPVTTSNYFGAFGDEDIDDDESEVVKALSQLTPNIQFSSQKTKPQKQKKSSVAKMHMTKLMTIAREVKEGKITLPELDLP